MPTQEFELQTIAGPIRGIAPEGVMPPSPYSWLLANNIPPLNKRGDLYLDLGCGTGVLAIVAAKMGGKLILASDSNPEALEATTYNARLNGCETQIQTLPAGDLFEPLGDRKVDGIIFNAAQLPLPPQLDQPSAYYAGERGRTMIEDVIFFGGRNHLKEGGGLLFTNTSLVNYFKTIRDLWDNGFVFEIRGQMELPFRDFYDKEWIEKTYQAWMSEARSKFQSFPYLNLQERLFLEKEGLYRKDDSGVYFETVSVLHAAKVEYEVGRDEYKNSIIIEKPNFLHPG